MKDKKNLMIFSIIGLLVAVVVLVLIIGGSSSDSSNVNSNFESAPTDFTTLQSSEVVSEEVKGLTQGQAKSEVDAALGEGESLGKSTNGMYDVYKYDTGETDTYVFYEDGNLAQLSVLLK